MSSTEQPGPEEIEAMKAEREQRLDPENRPPNSEVDNTDRDFDSEAGMFTDEPDYRELPPEEKPYDDSAGETASPDGHTAVGAEPGTESVEPPLE